MCSLGIWASGSFQTQSTDLASIVVQSLHLICDDCFPHDSLDGAFPAPRLGVTRRQKGVRWRRTKRQLKTGGTECLTEVADNLIGKLLGVQSELAEVCFVKGWKPGERVETDAFWVSDSFVPQATYL